MDIVTTYKIPLPNGLQVEVEASQEFINKLVQHFELQDERELTQQHVQHFMIGSLSSALDKLSVEESCS